MTRVRQSDFAKRRENVRKTAVYALMNSRDVTATGYASNGHRLAGMLMPPHGKRTHCGGFTLVELLVTLLVIAILVGLLFPAFTSVRNSAKYGTCVAHLKSIGSAVALFVADNNGDFPYGTDNIGSYPPDGYGKTYDELLIPYLESGVLPRTHAGDILHHKIFDCPAVADPKLGSPYYGFYSYNMDVLIVKMATWQVARKQLEIPVPSKTFLLGCSGFHRGGGPVGWGSLLPSAWGKTKEENPLLGYYHPGNSCNFLMADGHVESHTYEEGVPPFAARDVYSGATIRPGEGPCYLY